MCSNVLGNEWNYRIITSDPFRDFVPFVQVKKLEKHPWRKLLLVKLQAEPKKTKSNTPPWVFSCFLNGTYGTKSRRATHIEITVQIYSAKYALFLQFQGNCKEKNLRRYRFSINLLTVDLQLYYRRNPQNTFPREFPKHSEQIFF